MTAWDSGLNRIPCGQVGFQRVGPRQRFTVEGKWFLAIQV